MKNPYMPLIIGIVVAGMFNAKEHPEGAAACAALALFFYILGGGSGRRNS
jgi:hypothetical protein